MRWFVDTNPAVLCSLIRGPKPHEIPWLISLRPCGIASTASWRLASPCCWRCPHSLQTLLGIKALGEDLWYLVKGIRWRWKSTRNRDFTNKDWWMESSSGSSCWWIRHSGDVRIIPNQQVSASDGNHLQMDDKCVLEIAYWTIQTGSRFMYRNSKKNYKNINSIQFLLVVHVNLFETTGYSSTPITGTRGAAPRTWHVLQVHRPAANPPQGLAQVVILMGLRCQATNDQIKHLIASDSIWIPRYH